MLPNKFASAFEVSYMLFGKAGYLVTCFLFTSLTFGCLLLYYLMMAENIAAIFAKEEESGEESFWYSMITNQNFCTFAFSLTQLPLIFKRSLQEMKFMSYFASVAVLCFLFFLIFDFSFGEKAIDDPA